MIGLPRQIFLEEAALKRLKDIPEGRVLILSDRTTYRIAGKRAERILKNRKPETRIISDGLKLKARAEWIVAVGGGRIIDYGKLLALKNKAELIAVPTAPSHDGIFSPTITLPELNLFSKPAKPPFWVIADLEILREAPERLIRAGIGDAFSKYTSVFDWRLAAKKGDAFSEPLATLAWEVFENTARNLKEILERDVKPLMESLLYSGLVMCIWGSSQPVSGSEHAFSHALDRLGSPALHGEQVALGTLLMAYFQGQDWKFIRRLLQRAGLPTKASDLGLEPGTIVRAVMMAKDIRERWSILKEIRLTEEKVRKACRKLGIF